MGESSDASFELFASEETIAEALLPFTSLESLGTRGASGVYYEAADLLYRGEDPICAALRAHGVAYEFLQMGDAEYEPTIRFYHPDVLERFGYASAPGEWRGSASGTGEALVPVSVIDRILTEMPDDADDVWLREQLALATAARWRAIFERLRGRSFEHPSGTQTLPPTREIDHLPHLLGADPAFTYVRPGERYLVVLAVSYDHDSDPTDTGERIVSPRDAAHWALELTRDDGSASTLWSIFDAARGEWTVLEQHEIEES